MISVEEALKNIDSEVFVVDNASTDGSCLMVRQRFPGVILIENTENVGFAKANNQAIRLARGEYVLLLNPDTVVEEDTFAKCLNFMDQRPNAGALTVKMIDGKGRFLPESKRALPSPLVSFYKIFGLAALFPKSKTFARYHLGHLDKNQIHAIEILPGAFMFLRRKVIDEVGLLDESFFMYGEDIDLSYRIIQKGYENYYYPATRIIHYKGESTKKGSINYVIVFYRAMIIFARKHFSPSNARWYILLINMAVYFRAFVSILKRVIGSIALPLIDAGAIALGFLWILPTWEQYRFGTVNYFPHQLVTTMIPAYIAVWVITSWFAGAYDKPQKLFAATRGIAIGSLIVLSVYGLLPPEMRFSRALILLGGTWAIIVTLLIRLIYGTLRRNAVPSLRKRKRIAIVGSSSEARRVNELMRNSGVDYIFSGLISNSTEITDSEQIATINQIDEFVRVNGVDEVIFCGQNISSQDIIKNMLTLSTLGIEYKIAPADSSSVIGSSSVDTQGELYSLDIKEIGTPASRKLKRTLLISGSLLILSLSPLLLPLPNKKGINIIRRAYKTIAGK